MSSTTKKPGDILMISLAGDKFAYAHVSKKSPFIIFYDYFEDAPLQPEDIVKLPIGFRVGVYDDVLQSGRWPKVGWMDSPQLSVNPPLFKQDSISGTLSIYHDDYADSGYERLATLSEVTGLERAAVWDADHIEDRLLCHFTGKSCKWVVPVDVSKVPSSQKA